VSLPQSAPSPDRAAELADVRARYQWDYDYLRPIPFLKVHGVQDTGVLALADVVIGPPATPQSRPRRRLGTPDSPTVSWPSSSHSRRCCGSPPRPICAILDNLPCQSGPDRDFFGRTLGEETARQRYLPAPRALLYRHDDGQLLLVAIQLGQTEADEVFTPADDAELWHRIKLLYAVADFNHHELSTHLLSVHFFRGKTGTQETLNIAMLYCAASAPDESKVDDSLRTPPLVDLSGHNLTVLPDLSSWSRLGRRRRGGGAVHQEPAPAGGGRQRVDALFCRPRCGWGQRRGCVLGRGGERAAAGVSGRRERGESGSLRTAAGRGDLRDVCRRAAGRLGAR
jgi:hypothetical protein